MIFKLKTIKNYSFEWVLNDLELFIYKLFFLKRKKLCQKQTSAYEKNSKLKEK